MGTFNDIFKLKISWKALGQSANNSGWNIIPIENFTGISAGIHYPQNSETVLFSFEKKLLAGFSLPECEGFSVFVIEQNNSQNDLLAVSRKPGACLEIFLVMATDLIQVVADLFVDGKLGSILPIINRIGLWQEFWHQKRPPVLSPQKEVGLFGELTLLREILSQNVSCGEALSSWKGPERNIHDFVFKNGSIEVKSTIGEDGFLISISSIDQLACIANTQLFLAAFKLSVTNDGQRLPELIKSVRTFFEAVPTQKVLFDSLLLKYGYSDLYAENYRRFFSVEDNKIFKIDDSFPRIIREKLPSEIVEASYSIDISILPGSDVTLQKVLSSMEVGPYGVR